VKAHVRLQFPQLKSTVITSTSVLDSSRSYEFANPNHRQMARKGVKMQKRSSIAIPHPVKTKMSRARRKHVLPLRSTPSVRYVALLVNATNINIPSRNFAVRARPNHEGMVSCLGEAI